MVYFLYSMLRTSTPRTVKTVFYIVGAVIVGDDVETFKCDYHLKDDDVTNSFIEKLINTISEMSNNDFNKVLKLLCEYEVI